MRAPVLALLSVLALSVPASLRAQSLIPAPALLIPGEGGFTLGPGTVIVAPGAARPLGETLAGYLRPATGLPLPVTPDGPARDRVRLEVATRWGVFDSVFNAEESTLAFLEDVLDQVAELFPGPFVHVGGDECPRREWAASPRALARMVREGLVPPGTRLADLQGWRDEAYGAEAARAGHDVVMAPLAATYLNFYETEGPEPIGPGSYLPLERVYAFEPVPAGLTPAEAGHILGGQGQLWTEYVDGPERAEYQLWPRLAALAEVLWSPAGPRDFPAFLARLEGHRERLGILGVAAHPR